MAGGCALTGLLLGGGAEAAPPAHAGAAAESSAASSRASVPALGPCVRIGSVCRDGRSRPILGGAPANRSRHRERLRRGEQRCAHGLGRASTVHVHDPLAREVLLEAGVERT